MIVFGESAQDDIKCAKIRKEIINAANLLFMAEEL